MSRLFRAALLGAAAFAVPAAINFAIDRQRRAPGAELTNDICEYAWPFGSIAYQVRGEGSPVVLIHGVGAGESSFEWRHNFEALAAQHTVYAFDLPGFGKSARRSITYTADLYVTALIDFLRDVVKEPAAVIASSVSGAYAVQAAALRPELITRLVLICPTGLETLRERKPGFSQAIYGLFSLPAVGTALYNGIASRKYIESYLRENIYADPLHVTPALVEHYYQFAHQPNAQYVLRSFLAGLLNQDITNAYARLTLPLLVCWGRQARMTPVENAQRFLKDNPAARLRIFEHSGLLPNNEEAPDFNAMSKAFLAERDRERALMIPSGAQTSPA